MKPTKLRYWNWYPEVLNRRCTLAKDWFSCGRPKLDPHPTMEFGAHCTAAGAKYEQGVCEVWAKEIKEQLGRVPSSQWAVPEPHVDPEEFLDVVVRGVSDPTLNC